MRKIAIGLLAGAGALLTGSANASDIYTTSEYTNSDLIQQVRMVCDAWGRCFWRPNYDGYYGPRPYYGPRYYGYGPRAYGPRYYGPRYRRW